MKTETLSWQAKWIGSSVRGGKQTLPPAPYLRREFDIAGDVKRASLHITALGLYECEINGQRVGDCVLTPGWTVYGKRVTYQTYDVTEFLNAGANAIGAILGDGWYCGHVGANPRENYGERPELLCQLEIECTDGSSQTLVSDASWKTATGPILEADLLMGEAYDARRELGHWSLPGYDESAWGPVLVGAAKDIAVEVPKAPPVRRMGEIAPIGESLAAGQERIIDLGQNITGRARLRFTAAPGRHLTFRYAEVLRPDGALYTENLRSARATDRYTCAADGIVEWEPRFTFHGFRYVGVKGLAPGDVCDVTGVVLHNDMPETGVFRCSHDLLNQLEHNILWGQKGNFLEAPTDCPQRDERLGWTGDAQVFIRTAAFHLDVRSFFHKWLQAMRDDQGPDGAVPPFLPDTRSFGLAGDGGPAWADAAIICPWTLYLCYADTDILRDHYGCMTAYMDFLAAHKVKDFIRGHPDVDSWGGFGDWLAPDGSGRTDGGTPKDLIGSAFYANNADLLSRIAAILGKDDDANRFRQLHADVVAAFRRRYVTPDGLIAAGTQTAYVLALHFGLVPEEARAESVRMLVRDIERRGMHLATGFVGTPYLLDVLEANGCLDTAYALLEQETFPSWLFPVKNGATTIWERWDGWTPEKGFQDPGMNSFNHYAYGCVGAWMVRSVAGLDLDESAPGYRHIVFRPRPGGSLTWAEATLDVAQGRIAIRWDLCDATLTVAMTVPEGATAAFKPPEGWHGSPTELGPGEHCLELRRC